MKDELLKQTLVNPCLPPRTNPGVVVEACNQGVSVLEDLHLAVLPQDEPRPERHCHCGAEQIYA